MAETNDLSKIIHDNVRTGESVLIIAIPQTGPHAGSNIVVITERKQLNETLDDIPSGSKYKRFLRSVTKAIRLALNDKAVPTTNQNLLDDLILLFGLKLLAGNDSVLQGSGLMSLLLIIDPDESLTWQQRGMLDPAFMLEHKLNESISRLY